MCNTKWGTWLRRVTKQQSSRRIAEKVGVSHTTVQRWVDHGVPVQKAWELTLRFNGDPIETLVLLGRIRPEDVPALNYAEIVKYAPADALTRELHSRTVTVLREHPDIDLQKRFAEFEAYQE